MTSGFDMGFKREHLQLIEIYMSKFAIIWLLDDAISIQNESRFINITDEVRIYLGLQNIEQHVYKFYNVQTCIEQLCTLNDRNVILFISRNQPLNDADYSLLCEMPHVEYIYQLGSDIPCRKMRGEVFNSVDQLSQVESDLHIIPLDILATSIENLDHETKTFFIIQLLMELLQELPCIDREKEDFITFCVNYGGNRTELENIRNFDESYLEKTAIWWYTGDTFISHFVNRICRERNPISIIRIHYFINQLFLQLRRLYFSQLSTELKSEIQLYRGKSISVQELYRFQRAVGRFVVTNSFVSTSKNKKVALRFGGKGKSQSKDKVSVLYAIRIAAHDNPSKPMALIDQSEEKEVLLSSGIVLRVDSVKKIGVSV